MRKPFKTATSLVLSVIMLLSIIAAGCSNGGKATDTNTAANAGDTAKTTDKPKEEKVTLRFSHLFANKADPATGVLQNVVDQFMKDNPLIKIEQEAYTDSQYHDKLKTEIASDTLADVFMSFGGSEVREAVDSKKVMDLTPLLDADPQFKASFLPGALEGLNVIYPDFKGIWAMPWQNVVTGFYYNSELFDKAGVQPPKTWTELLDVIAKLKASGTVPWVVGGQDGWRIEHIFTGIFYKMNGLQKARDIAARKASYSDPDVVAVFKKIAELRDLGAFGPNPASVDWAMEQNLFKTGKAAMTFGLDAFAGLYTSADSPTASKVKVAAFPYFEGKEQYKDSVFAGGAGAWALSSKLQGAKKEAAIKFLKTLTGTQSAKLFQEANAITPAIKVTNVDDSKLLPVYKAFSQINADAKEVGLDMTEADSVASTLSKLRSVCTGLLNKQLTPEQAAKEMDNEIAKNSKK